MDDDAYFSRWIVVRFGRQIEKTDNFLIDKLTTTKETPGLLNFALVGLGRLLNQGVFSYQKSPDETKNEMMKSGSSIAIFVSTYLVKEPGAWVSTEALYLAYKTYATQNGLAVLGKIEFGRKIKVLAPYITKNKGPLHNGKQPTGWSNVKIFAQPTEKVSRDSIHF